jgi:hypothetical protein
METIRYAKRRLELVVRGIKSKKTSLILFFNSRSFHLGYFLVSNRLPFTER